MKKDSKQKDAVAVATQKTDLKKDAVAVAKVSTDVRATIDFKITKENAELHKYKGFTASWVIPESTAKRNLHNHSAEMGALLGCKQLSKVEQFNSPEIHAVQLAISSISYHNLYAKDYNDSPLHRGLHSNCMGATNEFKINLQNKKQATFARATGGLFPLFTKDAKIFKAGNGYYKRLPNKDANFYKAVYKQLGGDARLKVVIELVKATCKRTNKSL